MDNPETSSTNITVDYLESTKIKFFMSPIDGRGVVATQDISEREIIERCPMVPLMNRSRYQLEPTVWRYCYPKPLCDCSDCKNHGFLFFMVAGHGMIYNHQDDNNADIVFNFPKLYADVIAKKEIKKGEEVFVNYGEDYFKNIEKKSLKDVIPN